jgi:hypothetical protein
MQWLSAHLVLRGERDIRDLISLSPQSGGSYAWSGPNGGVTRANSLGYRGRLRVVAVPRSSVWSLTLSDVPVVRTPSPTLPGNWGDYPSYRHSRPPPLDRQLSLSL